MKDIILFFLNGIAAAILFGCILKGGSYEGHLVTTWATMMSVLFALNAANLISNS